MSEEIKNIGDKAKDLAQALLQDRADESKTKTFKHIVKGCAIALCLLFFTAPLVKCSADSSINASGWEMSTGTGKMFKESKGGGNPLIIALLAIPAALLALAFKNKPFAMLRNVSAAGLAAEIIFLAATYIKFYTGDEKGAVVFTGFNWLILLIYLAAAGLTYRCAMQEKNSVQQEGGSL